ncbi:MAG: integrin alpha [Planctomycetota bacterium]
MHTTRLLLVALVVLPCCPRAAPQGTAQPMLWELNGASAGAQCGTAVVRVGDLSGDQIEDYAVGYRGERTVRAVSGRNGAVLWTQSGAEGFGQSLAAIGDLDGDGLGEIIVGAPFADLGGTDAGRVEVLSGADGSLVQVGIFPFRTALAWNGDAPGDRLGWSVGAGDLDGDGADDVLVGALFADDPVVGTVDTGMVTAFSGLLGLRLFRYYGDQSGERLGASVAWTTDVTGDGGPDLLVGAPRFDASAGVDAGRVVVLAYDALRARIAHYVSLFGTESDELFGTAVALVGDVGTTAQPGVPGGPGVPDFAVGAPNHGPTNHGRVYLISGGELRQSPVMHTWEGESDGDQLGRVVAGVGDLDSDGLGEIAFSAPSADKFGQDSGCLYIHAGSLKGLFWLLAGDQPGEMFGWSFAFGSGLGSFTVGAPFGASLGSPTAGAVRRFTWVPATFSVPVRSWPGPAPRASQPALATLPDVDGDGVFEVAVGDAGGSIETRSGGAVLWRRTEVVLPGHYYGTCLAALGDVNGDGVGDLATGSEDTTGGSAGGPGLLQVLSGLDGVLLHHLVGDAQVRRLGEYVAAAGDLDGDGYADFFATAVEMGVPGTTTYRAYSGRNGRILTEIRYPGPQRPVVSIEDVSGDGLADWAIVDDQNRVVVWEGRRTRLLAQTAVLSDPIVALAPLRIAAIGDAADFAVIATDGVVRAFDAASGAVRWIAPLALPQGSRFSLAPAGDFNGDGWPDLVVGGADAAALGDGGAARILSGVDGSVLWHTQLEISLSGTAGSVNFGIDVTGAGDWNGDGRLGVAVGMSAYDPVQARGHRMWLTYGRTLSGTPFRVTPRGVGCPGVQRQPRLDTIGAPAVGSSTRIQLRAAPPGAAAVLALGASAHLDLGPLGAPGCVVRVGLSAAALLPAAAGSVGVTSRSLWVPPNPALLGGVMTVQWLVVDAAANPFGLTVSDAFDLVIGGLRR